MGDVDNKKDIVLTFDTLFEMLRKEKDREELQELPISFFIDLVNYLKEKKEFLQKNKESLFGSDEAEKTTKQLSNIVKVVRELYNRRERKIIVLSVNKALTGSHLIDTSRLLGEERSFFEDMTKVLVSYRKALLEKAINTEIPLLSESLLKLAKDERAKKDIKNDYDDSLPSEALENQEKQAEIKPSQISGEKNNNTATANPLKVRFIDDVPRFIGPDLEVLGPFEKGQEHIFDREISEILINSNKAEEI